MSPFRRVKNAPEPPGDVDGATISIGVMRRKHVRAVAAIESQIFPRPWSQALYLSELAQPATRIYYVALAGEVVVGYIGCMLVGDEGHITTVGVDPRWHRRRIATRLLVEVVGEARSRGATALTLEVRVSNLGAQALYHAFGFVPAGIRKNYYAEVNEDGLVMWADAIDADAYKERLERLETLATSDVAEPFDLDRPSDEHGSR